MKLSMKGQKEYLKNIRLKASLFKVANQMKQLSLAFILFTICSINGYAQNSNINEQSEILGTWIPMDKQNRLGNAIVITADSLKFENDHLTVNNYYSIDSITDLDHFWITVDDKETNYKSKFCLIKSSDFMYLSHLKSKIGISDHFTDCFLYRKLESNLEIPNISEIKDLEIFIDKNILLESDCGISYSEMTNIFHIAYDQKLHHQKDPLKIVFRNEKHTKTSLKADLRGFYHENYKIYYDSQVIPFVAKNNKSWNNKSKVKAWIDLHKLQENSWIAIVGRYNPNRNDCNKIYGENIVGQIQDFEVIKLSCFLERINR